MSLSQETLIELMAYADGELEGDDRARIEALIASSDEARRALEAGAAPAIGDWVRASSDAHAAKADGIVDAVMAGIARDEKNVVSIGEARRARRPVAAPVVVAVIGVLSLAAAAWLWVRGDATSQSVARAPTTQATTAGTAAPPPAPLASAPIDDTSEGIEVNELEAPSHDVSVFYMQPATHTNAAGRKINANSVVIWIGETPPASPKKP